MSLEIALSTRNAIQRGEQVKITVPPRSDLEIPSDEWAKVLGAFAASYSLKFQELPSSSTPRASKPVKEDIPGVPSFADVSRVSDRIADTLSSMIKKRDIGEVAKFSAPSRLLRWADEQMVDKFSFKNVPAKEATGILTESLADRGISTFADMSMGVAVLLTELLSSDESFGRDPEVIRKTIAEKGYGLLIPIMASEAFFNQSTIFGVKMDLHNQPRRDILRSATHYISYTPSSDQVTQLRWKLKYPERDASTGCPFLYAEHGKAVKTAWKVAVNIMWDDLLDWRAKNPIHV